MPQRSLRPCAYPGCINLVRFGRCEEHKDAIQLGHDPERQRLYDRQWKRIRMAQLASYPWCAECLKTDIFTPATDVDHVVPHRGDRMAFVTGELQSLCHSCHAKKTRSEMQDELAR